MKDEMGGASSTNWKILKKKSLQNFIGTPLKAGEHLQYLDVV